MIACLDVSYRPSRAVVACLTFNAWPDATPRHEFVGVLPSAEPYEAGHFCRRELPCLLSALAEIHCSLIAVVIDAYVWLGPDGTPGLGARLHEALRPRTPVIGVAKTVFLGAPAIPITRGRSRSPLFVSSVGIRPEDAAASIQRMHGSFRIPTLLKRVDQLCRAQRLLS